jgi:hypothetical protein
VPTFCRHNRFIERCPICRETLPGLAPAPGASRRRSAGRAGTKPVKPATRAHPEKDAAAPGRARGRERVRIYRDVYEHTLDDGFRSALAPGLRSRADAERLAAEIGFAQGRLAGLASDPPGLYAEAGAHGDIEEATWICLLAVYLSPLEGPDPFRGIRAALEPPGGRSWRSGELPHLDGIPLGPLTSHDPDRGSASLGAYRQWVARAGSQERAFAGDSGWAPGRRFERIFERLAIPGLRRFARYELLVTLGRLGLYELRGDSLHLSAAVSPGRGSTSEGAEDPTLLAAKRVFGIGDAVNLERRTMALAEAADVPLEALNLALANWIGRTLAGTGERVTLGVPAEANDATASSRARVALEA